jgi:hypothetical protein
VTSKKVEAKAKITRISRIYEQVFNNKAMNEVRALEKY